jgi:hypothetical protein
VTVQHCTELKYPCDYGTNNPICPGINGETSYVNKGPFVNLAK